MNPLHRSLLIIPILIFSVLLSSCSGRTQVTTGWPGLTVDQDTAYLAAGTEVIAVNLANGVEKWRFPEKADTRTFYSVPALTQDGQLLVGGYDNILYSINPKTGQETPGNWPFKGAKSRYIAGPLVSGQAVYAPSADEYLFALDLSGKLNWSFQTKNANWATPVTDGKLIFLPSTDHFLYAVDSQSHRVAWPPLDLGGSLVGTPTLSNDGTLYLGTFGSEMIAIDAANGKIKWRKPISGWGWAGPALVDNKLYFGDLAGNFYAMDTNGNILWQVQPDQSSYRSIADRALVVDNTIYLSCASGTLYALNIDNGNPRWNKTVGGKLMASPVLAGDTLLVAPSETTTLLQAFDKNGTEKWVYPAAKK